MKSEITKISSNIRDKLQQIAYWEAGVPLTPEQANRNIKILAEAVEALVRSIEMSMSAVPQSPRSGQSGPSMSQPAGWSACQIICDGAKFALRLSDGGMTPLAGLSQLVDMLGKGTGKGTITDNARAALTDA